jgi:hypothetical protein
VAGCAVAPGIDADARGRGDAAIGETGTAWTPGSGEGPLGDGGNAVDSAQPDAVNGEEDAAADGGTEAGSLDASRDGDARVAQDAGLEASLPDGGADAGNDAGDDAGPEAGLDGGPDAGIDADADAGCDQNPQITFLTPSFGSTIRVRTGISSTYVYAFSVHVDFPCAPMLTVQFDYVGPAGTVLEQETVFTSYADPFTQQTQVGGASSSLAAHDGGQSTSSWIFSVTAVDGDHRTTTVSEAFGLSTGSGG